MWLVKELAHGDLSELVKISEPWDRCKVYKSPFRRQMYDSEGSTYHVEIHSEKNVTEKSIIYDGGRGELDLPSLVPHEIYQN